MCHSLNWSSLYFIEPIILFHSAFAVHLNSQTLSRFSSPLLFCPVHFSLRIYCPVHTTSLISSKVLSFGVLSFTFIFYRSHTSRFTSLTIFFFSIVMNSHVPQYWKHWMSQTPTVNHNFVLSPAGKGNIISYFFSLDLNKTLVRYPTFLFVRSFFMSLIKLIGLQENLLKCGLFCCNCSAKSISNQYLITGFTFFFVFLHKLSLVRLGIY